MITISVHGRSGQGIETTISTLAKAALSSGMYAQSLFFPTQERKGAHTWGLVKMDKTPITSRQIEEPDIVLIFDTTLELKTILENIKEKGVVIFNSQEKLSFPIIKKMKAKSFSLDATGIAMRTINKPIPNTVMLGAFAKGFNKITLKSIKSGLPNNIDKENIVAIDEGFKAVK